MSVPASALSHIPRVSQLTPRVLRVLGCNPGPFTLQGTNTYVVGSGRSRVLIDTGDGEQPEYYENLHNALKEADAIKLSSILITHWHQDHVGGIRGVVEKLGLEVFSGFSVKNAFLKASFAEIRADLQAPENRRDSRARDRRLLH